MAERHLALLKKVSLADINEGWGDCYALVRGAEYDEWIEFAANDLKSLKQEQVTRLEMDFVKQHFIKGEIRILDDNGDSVLVPMELADIERSAPITDALYFAILGVKVDPKALSTSTEPSPTSDASTQPSENSNTTKTTSPSASPKESPTA